jgi:site-specific DNA recombinase
MKTAIYARVSSDSQDVELSISAQLRALRDYAVKHGHEITREYVDEAESGRSDNRPAFREMISVAKTHNPPFESILVWKLNRFARNRIDSATYKKLLRDRGIKVISINEPLDDSPSGHLLEGVIETIDQFYSENMGEDIRRGMRENATRGFYNGSKPPYGMKKSPVKDGAKTRYKLEPLLVDTIEIQVLHRVFDMITDGAGCKEIAMTLNREGFRTSGGQKWGKTTIHKLLTNEAYCGTLVWGGRPEHKAIHSGIPPIRIENAWPAIIDRNIFRLVQEKMSSNAPKAVHPRTIPSFFMLSGMLFCSCGRAMIGRSAKSHRYYYYQCNRGDKQGKEACPARPLSKEKLEREVIEQIKERILSPDCLEELVKVVNEDFESAEVIFKNKINAIDTEFNDVNSRLLKLYDALETGKLTLDDLSPRIKELRNRQNELAKARAVTEAELIARGKGGINQQLVKAHAQDIRDVLEEAQVTESKAFLRTFIKRIVVDNGKVKVLFNLPVPQEVRNLPAVLPIDTPGGAEGTRTPDPFLAKEMLSQLSYSPWNGSLT